MKRLLVLVLWVIWLSEVLQAQETTVRLVCMAEDLQCFSRHAKDGQYKTTTMEKRRKPFSLLKMAWHFKDWRYVKVYHDFKRQRRREVIKSSGIYKWWSGTWLQRKIKGE